MGSTIVMAMKPVRQAWSSLAKGRRPGGGQPGELDGFGDVAVVAALGAVSRIRPPHMPLRRDAGSAMDEDEPTKRELPPKGTKPTDYERLVPPAGSG
jgi:hypothetical protein